MPRFLSISFWHIFFLIPVFLLLLVSCASRTAKSASELETPHSQDEITTYMKEIEALLGTNYVSTPNVSETYYLCVADGGTGKKPSQMMSSTFLVHDHEGKIVVDKRKIRGSVKWQDDESVLIMHQLGVEKMGDPNSSVRQEVVYVKKQKP